MKKVLKNIRNFGMVFLATMSFANYSSAQFGCGSGVVLTNGYTATGITTPGNGGPEDWNVNPTGTTPSTFYWDDDVYLYEYTSGATAENISMTIYTRKTYTGIGIFNDCVVDEFSNELNAVGTSAGNTSKTVSATIPAGETVYIAIGQWGTPNDLDFDVTDFTVTALTCPDPSTLSASNITPFEAVLGWTEFGSAAAWNIEYGAPGFTAGSGTTVAVTANPYTLTGLSAETDYEFYVQSDCGGGDLSGFVGPFSFSTPATCLAPSTLTASNMTLTSADLGWTENGTATLWNIEYGAPGFVLGSGTTETGVTNAYTLTGLTADTQYEFYVQADCGSGDLSSWSGPMSFITGYCLPSASGSATYVDNFSTTGGSTNISNLTSGFTTGGYFDGTAQAVTSFETSTFNFTADIVGGTAGFAIWIDWNNDLVFDNATEKAFNTTSYGNGPFTGSIAIPAGTPVGDLRMRITVDWNASNPTLPCASRTRAEFEDYTLTIVAPPACIPPSVLTASNILDTQAELGWTESGTATVWNVEWGTAGFTPGSGTTETGVTNPFVLTGLTATTDYDFYVQADCGGSTSSFSSLGSFTTACATFTAPFYEGFNNAVQPACWENLSSNTTSTSINNFWNFNKQGEYGAAANGKTIGTFVSSDGSTPNPDSMMLITPWVNLTPLTAPELTFEWFSNNTNTPGDNVPLIIDINDGTSWTNLDTLKGDNAAWIKVYYDLSAYAGNTVQVRFMTNQTLVTVNAFHNDILLDEVRFDELTTCAGPGPLNTGVVSTTSVELDWTENGTATTWNIEYGPAGFTPGTGTPELGVTTNPYVVTGLTANTAYDFYVQSDCGTEGLSIWSAVVSVSTMCNAYSIPYFEGFETGYTHDAAVGGCILQESETGTIDWTANNTLTTYNRAPNTGSWNAFLRYGNTDWMFIPVDLVGGTSYTMEMYARQDGATATNANLSLSYGSGANAAAMTNVIAGPTDLIDGAYQMVSGEFTPATTGVYYVGIKGFINSSPWYISVDDISIYETPPCADPTALTASNFTTTSADLAWTENGSATTWNIEYGPAGFTQGTGTAMQGVTANPYTLTGLMPCMNYEYYVQADCGSGDLSAFVGPFAFTTLAAPATGTDTQVACETFDWIDGNTYTSSNNTATFTIVGGGSSPCGNDSIVTLDLTINYSVTGTDVQSACGTFTWIDGNDYTADNNTATYTIVGGAATGCDSIVTLDLTIDTENNAGDDDAITVCMNEPVDLAALLSSGADAGGVWLNPAGTAITGTVITASSTAGVSDYSYVVAGGSCPISTAVFTITVDGGCDYLSITEEKLVDISVYPNPATSILTILNPSNTSSLKVEMLDMNGRIVLVENQALNNATQATLAIENLERGIYTLRVYNNEGQKTFKIVKQ